MRNQQKKAFQKKILKWSSGKRRDFIWRKPRSNPFAVLLSEMLLRKTRADTVDKVVRIIYKRYPSPKKLARANKPQLAKIIKPLGLHRMRSKALIDVAKRLSKMKYRKFLNQYDNIITLPHVGRYIANAVLCMCYNKQVAMVDANIVRLMNRVFKIKKPVEVHKADYLWNFVNSLIPTGKAKGFNLAMLDLTALICLPRGPKCGECPLLYICKDRIRSRS